MTKKIKPREEYEKKVKKFDKLKSKLTKKRIGIIKNIKLWETINL